MSDIGNMSNYDRRQRAMARDAEQKRDNLGRFGEGASSKEEHAAAAKQHTDKANEHRASTKGSTTSAHNSAQRDHRSAANFHEKAAAAHGTPDYSGWAKHAKAASGAAHKSSEKAAAEPASARGPTPQAKW